MSFYNSISRNFILPVSDLLLGNSISKKLGFLKKSQYWSRSDLEEFQSQMLKKMAHHIYNHVPYYYHKFRELKLKPSDIRSKEDLSKLPIVTKDIIRQEGIEKFTATNIKDQDVLSFHSSGSTGEPFHYYMTREAYSIKYASAIRGWSWMGYRLGDDYIKMSQNQREGILKKVQDKFNNCNYFFIPDLRESTIRKIINQIEEVKPSYLRSYPDPLFFMAKIMKRSGIKFSFLKGINTTGNILYPEARQLIEERMGCSVYDSYSVEGSALFYQLEGFEGYLGSMENAISEVVDKNGDAVNVGETGNHVTTELWNYAMPFIRYNTQDLVKLGEQREIQRRNLFVIDQIMGRDSDVLVAPNGNLLIVHLFTIYFEYYDSIQQFQVEQTTDTEFIIRLVVNNKFNSEIKKKIQNYWIDFLGDNVQIHIEVLDEIPLLNSGKRRFLIRNKSIKLPY